MKKLYMFIIAAALPVTGVFAQTPAPADRSQSFMFVQKGTGEGTGQGTGEGRGWKVERPVGEGNLAFAYSFAEIGGDRETVKGSPYTATSVTEITQHLADGNRIANKTTASLARDSQGRTRREETVGKIGGLQANGLKVVSIHDPVAGTEFVFKSDEQPAEEENHTSAKVVVVQERKTVRVIAGGAAKENWVEQPGEVKHESLGTQTIEGVSAEGKRETRTIPAGAIGNDRPIEITSETWYSPDLHAVVLSKRTDPRMGETVYRLTDIRRGEPDASLFQPPPGTKMENDRQRRRIVIGPNPKEE